MDDSVRRRLLGGLSEAQAAAVVAADRALCIVAGAGSGKTRVLTRRVARRVADGDATPEHVLVVTFTRKAAGELRQRLWQLGVPPGSRVGTIHAAAYGELRRVWADRGQRPPALVSDTRRLLAEVPGAPSDPRALGAVAAELSWSRAMLIAPGDDPSAWRAAGRQPPLPAAQLAELAVGYRAVKRRRQVIDLDDLLEEAAAVLEADPALAAAARWRIRHLFVDEFQDVNRAQWRLLRAWLGPEPDLCVVGDPRQAIYGWNGADPQLLHRLPTLVPGMRVLQLHHNFRSTPQVLAVAEAALGAGDAPDPDADRQLLRPTPLRPDGPPPQLRGFPDDHTEAEGVARWLRHAHRPGRRWRQLAVLARTNARLAAVAQALDEAGIPYQVGGRRRSVDAAALDTVLRQLASTAPQRPLREALADLPSPMELGLRSRLNRLADELAEDDPDPTVGAFVSWFAATVGDGDVTTDDEQPADAVTLATFHRAKGLEWDAVALIGLEGDLAPMPRPTVEGRAEEHRLLYVACTRAGEELWCSWARSRHHGDRALPCEPSPLLAPLRAAADATPATAPAQAAGRLAELRRRLAAAG